MERRRLIESVLNRLLQEIDLGKAAFDVQRKIPVFKPPEVNTREEEDLFRAIMGWTTESSTERRLSYLTPDKVSQIRELMNDPRWSTVFKEPDVEEVHRGFIVSRERLSNLLGVSKIKLYNQKAGDEAGSWSFGHGPGGGPASWTKSDITAASFVQLRSQSHEGMGLLISAKVSENPGVFWDFDTLARDLRVVYNYEKEVISLSRVQTHRIRWVDIDVARLHDVPREKLLRISLDPVAWAQSVV